MHGTQETTSRDGVCRAKASANVETPLVAIRHCVGTRVEVFHLPDISST